MRTFDGELCIIVCSGNATAKKKSETKKQKDLLTQTLYHTFPEPNMLGAYVSAIVVLVFHLLRILVYLKNVLPFPLVALGNLRLLAISGRINHFVSTCQ